MNRLLCSQCGKQIPIAENRRVICLACGTDYGKPIVMHQGRFQISPEAWASDPEDVRFRHLHDLVTDSLLEV